MVHCQLRLVVLSPSYTRVFAPSQVVRRDTEALIQMELREALDTALHGSDGLLVAVEQRCGYTTHLRGITGY